MEYTFYYYYFLIIIVVAAAAVYYYKGWINVRASMFCRHFCYYFQLKCIYERSFRY